MRTGLRARFWIEGGMAVVTAVLFLVTLVQRDWIEGLVGFDPDRASGSLEWAIVGSLLLVTVALFAVARREWRRAVVAA